MVVSRIAPFFLLFLALGIISHACPLSGTQKRAVADIQEVVCNLKGKVDQSLHGLSSTLASGVIDVQAIVPWVQEIKTSLEMADNLLKGFEGMSGVQKQDLVEDVAMTVADIITDLDVAVGRLVKELGADVTVLIVEIDVVLNRLLLTLGSLVPGLLGDVATLVIGVVGSLKSILALTVATLQVAWAVIGLTGSVFGV